MTLWGIEVQKEVFSIIIVTTLLSVLIVFSNRVIRKADPLEKPKGLVSLWLIFIQFVQKLTKDNMGGHAVFRNYAPYVGMLVLYLFVSNTIGLFGITAPTSNFSVTLSLGLITWVMVQRVKIKTNGVGGFLKGFFEPIAPFVIANIFGLFGPLISMTLRMFGNVTSGSVIMELFYTFTGWLSSAIPILGKFNFIGVLLAPALHAYFDLFSGFIQMFIFVTLTTVYIGNELPEKE